MTDTPVPDEMRELIPRAAAEGARLLRVSFEQPPVEIVAAINGFVAEPPKAGFLKRVDNWNERALPLGALWGIQLVRQFGWDWIVVDDDGDKSIGIFDRIRSMGFYPFDYIFGCLESGEYPKILLAFNMLVANSIPPLEPGSYEDIAEGVQHIVPPL